MSLYRYDPNDPGPANPLLFGKRALTFHGKGELTKFIARRKKRAKTEELEKAAANLDSDAVLTALHAGWTASLQYIRMSGRKLRLVGEMVKGKRVSDADRILTLSNKRAAVFVRRVMKSAIAAASADEIDPDELKVVSCIVESGPTIKRVRFKDRGRVHPIMKRTCHFKIVIS